MSQIAELINFKIQALQRRMFTSLPGKVLRVKSDKECTTVDVKPLLNLITDDGYGQEEQPLTDVPVKFPSGGGACLKIPIKENDLVEIRFYCRFPGAYRNSDGSKAVTPEFEVLQSINNAYVVPGEATYLNGYKSSDDEISLGYDGVVVSISEDGEINLGGSGTERLVLGDSFTDAFLSHGHDTGAGPTTNTKILVTETEGQPPVEKTVATAGVTTPDGLLWKEDVLSDVSKTE